MRVLFVALFFWSPFSYHREESVFLQQSPLYVFWTAFAVLWATSLYKCVWVSVPLGCKHVAEELFFPLSSAQLLQPAAPSQCRSLSPSSQARREEYEDPVGLCGEGGGCQCLSGSRDRPSGWTAPWGFAFIMCPFLFLNAVFFSVKCFEGLLDLIMISCGLELGPELEGLWSQFKLDWRRAGSAPTRRLCSFLKTVSCYTHSNLQRLESSCQRWMGRLYSAAAVPAWRALISPGALLCRLKASWTIITIRRRGSGRIRNGLFTEATWVLPGEQDNFKVEERDSLAVSGNCCWPYPCLSSVACWGGEAWDSQQSSWRAGLWFGFILQELEGFSSLIQKIQHCQVYLGAKSSLERLKPATCPCTVLAFLGLSFAVSLCAAFWVKGGRLKSVHNLALYLTLGWPVTQE